MLTTDIHIPVTQTICDTTYSDTWILVCNFYLNYNILKYSYDIFIFHSFFFYNFIHIYLLSSFKLSYSNIRSVATTQQWVYYMFNLHHPRHQYNIIGTACQFCHRCYTHMHCDRHNKPSGMCQHKIDTHCCGIIGCYRHEEPFKLMDMAMVTCQMIKVGFKARYAVWIG